MTINDDEVVTDAWDEQQNFLRPSQHWSDVFKNIIRPLRHKRETATNEWMGYYQGLYKTIGPSPEMFQRLLKRNGFWNIPNPFYDGNPYYYQFCQDGVTLADIDFVLGRWEAKMAPKSPPPSKPERKDRRAPEEKLMHEKINEISQGWELLYRHRPHQLHGQSIAATEENNRQEWVKNQVRWERDALRCLTVLFKSAPHQWKWIDQIVHQDNIRLLCKIVYDGARPKDRPRLFKQWKKVGWVSEASQKWFKK